MGDHHKNGRALFEKSQPPPMPLGQFPQAQIQALKVLKREILLVPADKVRTSEAGVLEVLALRGPRVEGGEVVPATEPTWGPVPEGRRVVKLGDPLKDADCDIALVLQSFLVDTTVLDPHGNARATEPTNHVEFARMDWREWLALHKPPSPLLVGQ